MPEQKLVTLISGEVVEIFDGENRKDVQEIFNWSKEGFIKPVNGNWLYPKDYLEIDELQYNFNFRTSDVFVNGYPKSGTTWVQDIIWTIQNNPDLTHPMQEHHALFRIPWFEADSFKHADGIEWRFGLFSMVHGGIPIKEKFLDMFEDMKSPRVFKTHLFPSTINHKMMNTSKMVYIIRDPMDSFYSFYLFHRYMSGPFGLNKDLPEFVDNYMKAEVHSGNAIEHIRKWLPYKDHKNVYFIYYEDILRNPTKEIKNLTKFLEKELTEDQIQNVVRQTSFKYMKETSRKTEEDLAKECGATLSDDQASFYRKGVAGDSKNMPKEVYNKFVEFFEENMKDLNLPYTYKPK